MGPLEVLVVECPGETLKGEIVRALTSAVECGALRIVDITFIRKDAGGRVTSYELAELEEYELIHYDMVDETRGLLSVDDITRVGQRISANSSAVLLVIEHSWTGHLHEAIDGSNGRVVLHERIPTDVANAALDHDAAPREDVQGESGSCSGPGS